MSVLTGSVCLAVCQCVSGSITQKDEKSQNLWLRKSDSLDNEFHLDWDTLKIFLRFFETDIQPSLRNFDESNR